MNRETTTPVDHPWRAILVACAMGLAAYLIARFGVSEQQARLIGLIAGMVTLWTNEGLALGVVSLLPLILFPAADVAPMAALAGNYANPIIFLFLGGFMLAIAVEKTGLHKQISFRLLAVFPSSVRGMIFALALTAGLLSALLSNTTTALLLMPLALFLSEQPQLRARFALAIAYGASIGGIMTPIGTPPNLILLGFMEQQGTAPIPFAQWIGLVLPLAFTMFIGMSLVLALGAGKQPLQRPERPAALTSEQRRLIGVFAALLLLLLLNAPLGPFYPGLGLNEKAILLGFGLAMFAPVFGVLQWSDSKRIPYEIMFLFGAGFSIAHAFTSTGLADVIGDSLLGIRGLDPWLMILLVAAMITFATEITSNTALISMMLPVLYSVCTTAQLDTTLLTLVATICASYAFMLPIATPPNAIAIASGVVNPLKMLRVGFLLNLLSIALITLIAQFYWRPLLA
jgi:sodium-dependent dicarboxylate transporter 2/3/5